MTIALLSGCEVVAVCSSLAGGKLTAGILVLSEDFEPGRTSFGRNQASRSP
jgi:hypothetical protein